MKVDGYLSFLDKLSPVLAHNANLMEELMFKDPSSAIVKSRLFIEEIVRNVFNMEEITAPHLRSLSEKVSYLSRNDYIKKEIQQSFDTIRLAGNKAAHDGKYNNDIVTAYKLHEEMYKLAVWFYEVYYSGNLEIPQYEIPKPPDGGAKLHDLESLIEKKLKLMIETRELEDPRAEELSKINNETIGPATILPKDLEKHQSYLLREINRLKDSSREAIENTSDFSVFKRYLHVDRKIQKDLESILEKNKTTESNLVLLCGSVGDGKSHLLAYIKKEKQELIKGYRMHNDATESFSPNKDAMETLEEVLRNFSDENINRKDEKLILAINMGVLHNFINREHKKYSYTKLKEFVQASGLFSQNVTTTYSDNCFDLLSFGDYHSYELTGQGAMSNFYSSLLNKIVLKSKENPFYLALKEDETNNSNTMLHENYRFLQNENVREQIIQLVIEVIVRHKLVISARAFLNFIADILIPREIKELPLYNEFEILENSLPNLIFNRPERSDILESMAQIDPIQNRSKLNDQVIIELTTSSDWESALDAYKISGIERSWLSPFLNKSELSEHSLDLIIKSFIRIAFFTNKEFFNQISNKSMNEFLSNLYYFNVGDQKKIKNFYKLVNSAIYNWKGNIKKEYILMNQPTDSFHIAQRLNINPSIEHISVKNELILKSFKPTIVLAYYGEEVTDAKIELDIDYPLFELLLKVREGYRPNKRDEEDAVKFVEFIDKLMSIGEKRNEILISFPREDNNYLLKRDEFGSFVFERKY